MNYRRHIILLLFLLGGCIPVLKHHVIAPGVSGQVLDAETNTPLADVTLELQNMNDLSSTNGGGRHLLLKPQQRAMMENSYFQLRRSGA